jgi:hypothetical protein
MSCGYGVTHKGGAHADVLVRMCLRVAVHGLAPVAITQAAGLAS